MFLRERDWPAMMFELFVVALGVMLGLAASNWVGKRQEGRRTAQLVAAVRQDLRDGLQVERKAIVEIDAGLAVFEAARGRGERPPPYVLRIPGSDTPPNTIWEATFQTGLADLINPGLLFDLGFFYSEREGIGRRYSHYARFVEDQILPKMHDPGQFYDSRGALRPEYAANMDRLREWRRT